MLRELSRWLNRVEPSEEESEARLHLATAILLLEVARSDQSVEQAELQTVHDVLKEQWSLDESDLRDLLQAAGREVERTASLFDHVDAVNDALSQDEKYHLLLGLWRIACVDGEIHPQEEYLIRRIADLLYLSHTDFIRAKHQALGDLD